MIYLIPVKHTIQFGIDSQSVILQEFIEEKIKELGITLICEEASQQDLDDTHYEACVKEVADVYKIPHLLCDLTDDERTQAGLFTGQEFLDWIQQYKDLMLKLVREGKVEKMKDNQNKFELEEQAYQRRREKAWLSKFSNKKTEEILFILGAGHISFHRSSGGDGLDKLLEREGWEYKILDNKELY